MAKRWANMTREEKDAYNLLKRQKYESLPEDEKEAQNLLRRQQYQAMDPSQRGQRIIQMRKYYESHKESWLASLADLPEEEAMLLFFRAQSRKLHQYYFEALNHPAIYGEDDDTRRGMAQLTHMHETWESGWLPQPWKRYVHQERFNANPRTDADIITERCARREVNFWLRLAKNFKHLKKFGQKYPGRWTAEEFKKCELYCKVLIVLGQTCVNCGKAYPHFALRPVKKSDPVYVIPNLSWAYERMFTEGILNHEIWCRDCHKNMRIVVFAKTLAGKNPGELEYLRELRPRWLKTDGPVIRPSDSYRYWRDQTRHIYFHHHLQIRHLYHALYGTGKLGERDTYIATNNYALISKDMRDFMRLHPPPGITPPQYSESDVEEIYQKIFSKKFVNLSVSVY